MLVTFSTDYKLSYLQAMYRSRGLGRAGQLEKQVPMRGTTMLHHHHEGPALLDFWIFVKIWKSRFLDNIYQLLNVTH